MVGNPAVRRLADWPASDLEDLAAEHGTPLYVLDVDRAEANLHRLERAFPEAGIHYAVKANADGTLLSRFATTGIGAECASAGEVRRALDAGFDQSGVLYTPVNPPARDLDAVIDWWEPGGGLTVTAGAIDTIDRLAERGYDGRVAIRVHPGVGAGHGADVATGADAKFGIPVEAVESAAGTARERGLSVVGLHAHTGSGIMDEDVDAHRRVVDTLARLAREMDTTLEYIDVGGGFGVPYRAEESPLDLGLLADSTTDALADLDAALVIEPGRYLVADAGVLLTRVNTIKEPPDGYLAGVDAGMTDLLRPALYDAHHEIRNLTAESGESTDRSTGRVSVVGPICESTDVFARDRDLPTPARGDLLAIGNAGAYGIEMASQYNSRPRPAVVGLVGSESRVLRRRESIEDVVATEVSR